jgi:hypothetical protein
VNLHNSSAGTIRASLRYPAFRWLLSGLTVSQTGDAAFRRDRWFGPGSGASLPDGTTPDSPSPDEERHDHNPA